MDLAKWQNLGYLFWAYVVVWGMLAGYLLVMSRRMNRLKREIDLLRQERRSGQTG